MHRLIELSLNDNQIQEVPVTIQRLTNLQMLSMARNKITGSLPIEVYHYLHWSSFPSSSSSFCTGSHSGDSHFTSQIWTLPALSWVSFSMNTIAHLTPESLDVMLFKTAPVSQLFVDFNKLAHIPVFSTLTVLRARYLLHRQWHYLLTIYQQQIQCHCWTTALTAHPASCGPRSGRQSLAFSSGQDGTACT